MTGVPPRIARGADEAADEAGRILAERARELARPVRAVEDAAEALSVVRFLLGGVVHAIESRYVLEVARAGVCAVVPGAPPLLAGVGSWRGTLLPVFDLSGLLGPGVPPSPRPFLLVLGAGGADLAVSVDEVLDVVGIPHRSLLAPPPVAPAAPGSLLLGVTDDRTLVLDGAALLADPRLAPSIRREA